MYTKKILEDIEEYEKAGETTKASMLREALLAFLESRDKTKKEEDRK